MIILFQHSLIYEISLNLTSSLDKNSTFCNEKDRVGLLSHSKNLRLRLYKLDLKILHRLIYKFITLYLRPSNYCLKYAIFYNHLVENVNSDQFSESWRNYMLKPFQLLLLRLSALNCYQILHDISLLLHRQL